MDIYTNLFSSKKINESDKIVKKKPKTLLHDTNITTLDLPYAPMSSPRNKNKNKNHKPSLFPSIH